MDRYLQDDGLIVGEGGFVVLQPEAWVGKPFPLEKHIDIGEQIRQGEWTVILYHADCPKCRQAILDFDANATAAQRQTTVLLEVPSESGGNASWVRHLGMKTGRLAAERRWLVRTPVSIHLQDGRVLSVGE